MTGGVTGFPVVRHETAEIRTEGQKNMVFFGLCDRQDRKNYIRPNHEKTEKTGANLRIRVYREFRGSCHKAAQGVVAGTVLLAKITPPQAIRGGVQNAVTVVYLMLDDLSSPADKGFEPHLEAFVLIPYLDSAISFGFSCTGERQARLSPSDMP